MTDKAPGTVGVSFAKGVLDDVVELTTVADDSSEAAQAHRHARQRSKCEQGGPVGGGRSVGPLV